LAAFVDCGFTLSLKTMEWALGLRASLQVELDAENVTPASTSYDLERIVGLRARLREVDSLIASLEKAEAEVRPKRDA
jgi:hypothetical protein